MTKRIIAVSFILATLLFVVGILLGTYTTTLKEQTFDRETQNLFLQTVSAELQFEIGADDPCTFLKENNLNDELNEIEEKLVYLQDISNEESAEFQGLRRQYFLLEIRHWLLHKKANSMCEDQTDLILYFYADNCDACDDQGLVLSAFRKKYDDVRVYSFEYNTSDAAVRTLISKFDVKRAPTIIFNEEIFVSDVTVGTLESFRSP